MHSDVVGCTTAAGAWRRGCRGEAVWVVHNEEALRLRRACLAIDVQLIVSCSLEGLEAVRRRREGGGKGPLSDASVLGVEVSDSDDSDGSHFDAME